MGVRERIYRVARNKMPKKNMKGKKKSASKKTEPERIVRRYKGQKKEFGPDTVKAPWDGSTFETQAQVEKNQSEYNQTFNIEQQPGLHSAELIRPNNDNRQWMIGNVQEKMNLSTTYTGVFSPKQNQERTKPYRPNENGIHYEYSGEKNSMTTTHDRTYGANEFPPQRLKSTVEDDNCGLTTMKTDFIYKRISSPVVPFRPAIGLSDTLGSVEEGDKIVSSNTSDFPIRVYTTPDVPMDTVTTTYSEFTGQRSPPAKSCKPAPRSNG